MMSVLLYLISVIVIFVGGILVMINGWGIQPQNWGWIIVGNFFTLLIASILQVAAKNVD